MAAIDDSAPVFATRVGSGAMAMVEGMGEAILNSNLLDGKPQNCLQNGPETFAKSSEAITNGIGHLKGDTIWDANPVRKEAAWLNGGVVGHGPRNGDATHRDAKWRLGCSWLEWYCKRPVGKRRKRVRKRAT